MRIAYIVHDLADPAVARRVRMLQTGGADVVCCGFFRSAEPPRDVDGAPAIALARTADGRFAQRAAAAAAASARAGGLARRIGPVDAIMARTLETLPLARALRARQSERPRLVYEVLDVHRLLLGTGTLGAALRSVERRLGGGADLLLTSSPAFLEAYFGPLSGLALPVVVVENKVLAEADSVPPAPPAAPPFRIGLFGALRCRRSVDLLLALSRRSEGRVEIVVAGRPSPAVFTDLPAEIEAAPHATFLGAYRNPADLPALYGSVHFAWAIDFLEAGGNSEWLLPNRLYEAAAFGAVPLARSGTETARLLDRLGCGVVLDGARLEGALGDFFTALDGGRHAREAARVRSVPRARLVASQAECRALVRRIGGTSAEPPVAALAPEPLT